jgi:restriction endonuclease Mrr
VHVKDTFVRIDQERERERQQRLAEQQRQQRERQERLAKFSAVRNDLLALFTEANQSKRGKALEGILNRLFEASGILVSEAFTLKGAAGEGVVEQIDGVIELDGNLYLVEMKWWGEPIGVEGVSQHLVRVFSRGHARGIFISTSGYTEPAISICREALQKSVVVLCKLEELIRLLEREDNLREFLKAKVNAAIVFKNPLHEPLSVI